MKYLSCYALHIEMKEKDMTVGATKLEEIAGMNLNSVEYDGDDVVVNVTDNDGTKYQVVVYGSKGENHRLFALRRVEGASEKITEVHKTQDEVIIITEVGAIHIQAEGDSDDGEAYIDNVVVMTNINNVDFSHDIIDDIF